MPGRSSDNAYPRMLADALEAAGAHVLDWSERRAMGGGIDVVHLHWPASTLSRSRWTTAVLQTAGRIAAIAIARLRGATVVWTVHNLASHDVRYPRTERLFWRVLPRLVDGWVTLSASATSAIERQYPALQRRPHAVVAMGHFRDAYPANVSKHEARRALDLPLDARVLGNVGRILRYKGVPALLTAFTALEGDDLALVVGGRCQDAPLRRELEELAARDRRIHLHLDRIPDADLQLYLLSADLVVLPFEEILNSSSALLALSFDRPVLVPARGALPALAAEIGEEWVHTYDGVLDAESLAAAVARPRPTGQAPLESQRWDRIAGATIDLYERAGRGRRRRA